MEQTQCWMWTKQKHNQESTTKPSCEDVSWEEQAFAEDAAGPLGGCIWPPRSYSCSFCRREFRSAQALGGHMNVHRRDRARLKQSTSPQNELLLQHPHHQNNHNPVQYPCTSFGLQHPPSQVCALVYKPNPNFDLNSRGSVQPTKENSSENTLVVQEHHKVNSPFSSPRSWSNFVSGRYFCASDSKTQEHEKTRIIESTGCRGEEDYVKPDLSVSLNLVVCRKRSTLSNEEEEEGSISSKRNRNDASPLPFFQTSSSSEVLELNPGSLELEDLDLELRLGDRPKVK